MTHRTLIVARMDPRDEPAVRDLFAQSDRGPLPDRVGVLRRDLFSYHGLYFHLLETRDDVGARLDRARATEEFAALNERLARHITPYLPDWKEPRDAMAHHFYHYAPPSP
ncbi:TcmI family type II polyketide cyclase [Streptomyces sp. SCA3-4]|uniref:TcmI family type II polyketide cyclase n=1 Tax=Streptomyces sichuanensis TaxID=2871810 RepID=UPI001CE2D276|nr:TcmI family type II polyketide cyclase [Streptomyces sichuanensis]MCA6091931.1 TcmI family type II polyketide cyclase [Streptomyces sichuanensis]